MANRSQGAAAAMDEYINNLSTCRAPTKKELAAIFGKESRSVRKPDVSMLSRHRPDNFDWKYVVPTKAYQKWRSLEEGGVMVHAYIRYTKGEELHEEHLIRAIFEIEFNRQELLAPLKMKRQRLDHAGAVEDVHMADIIPNLSQPTTQASAHQPLYARGVRGAPSAFTSSPSIQDAPPPEVVVNQHNLAITQHLPVFNNAIAEAEDNTEIIEERPVPIYTTSELPAAIAPLAPRFRSDPHHRPVAWASEVIPFDLTYSSDEASDDGSYTCLLPGGHTLNSAIDFVGDILADIKIEKIKKTEQTYLPNHAAGAGMPCGHVKIEKMGSSKHAANAPNDCATITTVPNTPCDPTTTGAPSGHGPGAWRDDSSIGVQSNVPALPEMAWDAGTLGAPPAASVRVPKRANADKRRGKKKKNSWESDPFEDKWIPPKSSFKEPRSQPITHSPTGWPFVGGGPDPELPSCRSPGGSLMYVYAPKKSPYRGSLIPNPAYKPHSEP